MYQVKTSYLELMMMILSNKRKEQEMKLEEYLLDNLTDYIHVYEGDNIEAMGLGRELINVLSYHWLQSEVIECNVEYSEIVIKRDRS